MTSTTRQPIREALLPVAGLRASGLTEQVDEIVLAANWDPGTWRQGIALAEHLRKPERQVSILGLAAFNNLASLSFRLGSIKGREPEVLFRNLRGLYLRVTDDIEAAIAGRDGMRYLDKLGLLCGRAEQCCDMIGPSGRPIIFDAAHFTVEGTDILGARIRAAGWFE